MISSLRLYDTQIRSKKRVKKRPGPTIFVFDCVDGRTREGPAPPLCHLCRSERYPGDISKYWPQVSTQYAPCLATVPNRRMKHHNFLDQGVGVRRRGRFAIGKGDESQTPAIPYEQGQRDKNIHDTYQSHRLACSICCEGSSSRSITRFTAFLTCSG